MVNVAFLIDIIFLDINVNLKLSREENVVENKDYCSRINNSTTIL